MSNQSDTEFDAGEGVASSQTSRGQAPSGQAPSGQAPSEQASNELLSSGPESTFGIRSTNGLVASGCAADVSDTHTDFPIAFKAAWSFSRGLTHDLLEEMSDSDLLFLPGPQLGAFWKQFRHVGRVQECYMEALITGRINFSPEGKSYDHGPSKKWLQAYLAGLDERLYEILDTVDWRAEMIWFDEKVKVFEHMMRMVSHETLHHGQWVVYMRLMNKTFPESWSVWGL